MSYVIFEGRVAAGIALLDEKVPNWRDKIDLKTLELRTERKCVLGQVFMTDPTSWESGYSAGCRTLKLSTCSCCILDAEIGMASDYGFNVSNDDANSSEQLDDAFEELQQEWERQLSLISA